MTASLVYAVRKLPAARADRRFAFLAGGFGGALGLASQALWLAADHPRTNWTLPRPHRFTAAGWYHAAFVTVMCAVIAALLAVALNRVTPATPRPRSAVAALAGGFACGLAFIALLAVDADVSPGGAGLAGALIALAVTLAIAVLLVLRRA